MSSSVLNWWGFTWPFRRAETELVATPPIILSSYGSTPPELLRLAIAQNADLDRLTKLMDLQERWERNEAKKAFEAAISRFKADAPTIIKNATVTFETKKGDIVTWDYSTIDVICKAVIDGLSAQGLSHHWRFEQPEAKLVRVTCVLSHEQGHTRESALQGPPDYSGDKSDIHAIYSTVTHLERYTLLGAAGLATVPLEAAPDAQPEMSAGNRTRENCALMANAENLEQLQAIFRAAYAEASTAEDKKAQLAYIRAKDTRRKELR